MLPRDGYVLEFDDQQIPHIRHARLVPTLNSDLWMSPWGQLYISQVTAFFSLLGARADYIKHLKLLRAGHKSAIQELNNLIAMAEQQEAPNQEGGEVEKWDCCDGEGNSYSWLEHSPESAALAGNDDGSSRDTIKERQL